MNEIPIAGLILKNFHLNFITCFTIKTFSIEKYINLICSVYFRDRVTLFCGVAILFTVLLCLAAFFTGDNCSTLREARPLAGVVFGLFNLLTTGADFVRVFAGVAVFSLVIVTFSFFSAALTFPCFAILSAFGVATFAPLLVDLPFGGLCFGVSALGTSTSIFSLIAVAFFAGVVTFTFFATGSVASGGVGTGLFLDFALALAGLGETTFVDWTNAPLRVDLPFTGVFAF